MKTILNYRFALIVAAGALSIAAALLLPFSAGAQRAPVESKFKRAANAIPEQVHRGTK